MELRDEAVTPHVAQNTSARRSAVDARTHPPSRLCDLPTHRKRVGGLRLGQNRGRLAQDGASRQPKVDWQFTLAMAAYDLGRLRKLLA
jgi:hypothetical protein